MKNKKLGIIIGAVLLCLVGAYWLFTGNTLEAPADTFIDVRNVRDEQLLYSDVFGRDEIKVDVYECVLDNHEGTYLVNDRGDKLYAQGMRSYEEDRGGKSYNIRLLHKQSCVEKDCGFWIYPREDCYTVVAGHHAAKEVKDSWEVAQEYYSKIAPVQPATDVLCPYDEAKCVYSSKEMDVYVYMNDGLTGTWISSADEKVLDIYGWCYVRKNEYSVETISPYYTHPYSIKIYPEHDGYRIEMLRWEWTNG